MSLMVNRQLHRRVFTAVVVVTIFATARSAEVYKWKDENGNIQFGDRPPAEAQTEIIEIQTRSLSGPASIGRFYGMPSGVPQSDQVILYGTTWCPVCRRARGYMKERGIAFKEYDVEKDPIGRRHYKLLNGKGVPIIVVGERRMNGFSRKRFDWLIAQRDGS